MVCAPLAGLVVGLSAAAAGGLLALLGSGPLLAAVATAAVPAVLTRGLHLDGLADTADGLGSGKPAEDALRIMKQSDIGPFGVITLLSVPLGQVAALAELYARSWALGKKKKKKKNRHRPSGADPRVPSRCPAGPPRWPRGGGRGGRPATGGARRGRGGDGLRGGRGRPLRPVRRAAPRRRGGGRPAGRPAPAAALRAALRRGDGRCVRGALGDGGHGGAGGAGARLRPPA
ncbi:cobalamin synthase [Streptomyces pristinaespiralis ATCC 25486]|uniref:Adenosylcobinamide-GDP ribazoletransferase n=1 Tax=Streptomyces pristinaespiralis (strain ATCC 25486 / DSM 40338 / CBS 914.69 / JCM 4507 / KCC S-0507 / NBRC 13074 / NRRL 2958 / 5647) TaxID=457429 RepID=D6X8N0_STRE2|nr:cobalamin synthase [Streptomyces pristinaespiralis ATCC 25486]